MAHGKLDRRVSPDFEHIEKHPYRVARTVAQVNKIMKLPSWHWSHNQGSEGSCVGHGGVMERAITNTAQNTFLRVIGVKQRRYDPIWLWNQAKLIDEWDDTNPGDDNGTSVRAAYDVLRAQGAVRVKTMQLVNNIPTPVGAGVPDVNEGVLANSWATTVDQMRTAISRGNPVTVGIDWTEAMDTPNMKYIGATKTYEYWVSAKGQTLGGHCVCVYGASDTRQAFRVKNSWGRYYPLVWLPYKEMQNLLDRNGEATIQTDK